MTFEIIKNHFDTLKANPSPVHAKIRGVIIGLLDKACKSKENRYQFAIALGMKPHSKDWTDGEWYAVSRMAKVDKVGGKWVTTEENFEKIVGIVMAQVPEAQMELLSE